MKKIEIFDTTLRDGGQDPKINYTIEDKKKLIPLIDSFGADFIEVGYALSNVLENILYQMPTKKSKLCAFGSTHNPKKSAEQDKGLKVIIETGAEYACIFGKTWIPHIRGQLKISKEKNLDIIRDSVRHLRENGISVIYDAEHFFSGFFDNKDYAFATLNAAIEGGAKRIVLCDTKGGMVQKDIGDVVQNIADEFKHKKDVIWGFHGHNDTGCAVANTLEFVENILKFYDVAHIQGTFNGYGERTGNAAINIVCANLMLKAGYQLPDINLKNLTEISSKIALISGKSLIQNMPYVGENAFAHKGGIHIHGDRGGASYNHIEPEIVGNKGKYLISNQSGKDAIVWFAQKFGYVLDKNDSRTFELLKAAKDYSTRGYDLNFSDAVGMLFMLKHFENKRTRLSGFNFKTTSICEDKSIYAKTEIIRGTIYDKNFNNQMINQIEVTSEGGPVDSQFQAIKTAVLQYYPNADKIKMSHFETDVLPIVNNAGEYSKSTMITKIEFTNNTNTWATIGVSKNRDMASFEAILSCFEYFLCK